MSDLIPLFSLPSLLRDLASTARLRQQLSAARADAEHGRELLRREREWRERMIEEVMQARADVEELREGLRRELESNGKLREQLGQRDERSAFCAGVAWARERFRTVMGGLGTCYALPEEELNRLLAAEREIPF